MKLLHGEPWAPFADLVAAGIQQQTISRGIIRGEAHWQAMPDPLDARKRLIRYRTLKPEYQQQLARFLGGNPEHIAWNTHFVPPSTTPQTTLRQQLDELIETGHTAHLYLFAHVPTANTIPFARAAAVLHWLQQADAKALGFAGTGQLHEAVCTELRRHNLPHLRWTNPVTLRRKLAQAQSEGLTAACATGLLGNCNKQLPGARAWNDTHDQTLRHALLDIMAQGHKYRPWQVRRMLCDYVRKYNAELLTPGEPELREPSQTWVRDQMRKPENRLITAAGSHGHKFVKDTLLPHNRRRRADAPCDLWYMDGTMLNQYHRRADGGIDRFALYIIIDSFSGMCVGWDVAYSENQTVIIRALEKALLRAKHLPKVIKVDNHGAFSTDTWESLGSRLQRLGVGIERSKVGNPQDKGAVEGWFKVAQNHAKGLPGFVGDGVKSKDRWAHVTPEVAARIAKNPPTAAEALGAVATLINLVNERDWKGSSVRDLFDHTPVNGANALTPEARASLFWHENELTIRRKRVLFTLSGLDYCYDVPAPVVLTHEGQRVRVRYSLDYLHEVFLYDTDTDAFLGKGQRVHEYALLPGQRTDEDWKELHRQTQMQQELELELFRRQQETARHFAEHQGEQAILMYCQHLAPKERAQAAEDRVLWEITVQQHPELMLPLEPIVPDVEVFRNELNTVLPNRKAAVHEGPDSRPRAVPVPVPAYNDEHFDIYSVPR